MGRRKKKDHCKSGVQSIDQAELNTKRNTKAMNKRKRISYNESDPGSYTDRNKSLSYKCRVGKSRKLIVVEEEDEAVRLTRVDEDIQRENRKLDQFYFYDEAFKPQSVEMLQVQPLFISGVILPSEETSVKVKETKVRCDSFGPIESWAISGFDEGKPIVWVSTVTADYECLHAATAYKPFFDLFYEKARACTLIYRKLSKTLGGNPDIPLKELIVEVTSSMRRGGNYSHGVPIEPLIKSWGEFIYEQLIGLDETYCDGDTVFNDLPVLLSLRDAGKWRVEHISEKLVTSQGVPYNMHCDQSRDPYDENKKDGSLIIARLMGELETWKLFKPNKGQRSVTASDIFFTNSELMIEKEFLVPTYFNTGLEKTDESTIFGSQSSEDTDELPQRILHDWSLYTSGSRFISLELLPMRSYGQRNVKIYGLGIMTDYIEDGLPIEIDFLQKHGTLIRLSEIQEWLIEFELSGVSILIETDNARYKLGKPSIQYASWYEPVLKTAKLAGRIIKLLREQSRVSRLSFHEAAKKISEFVYDDPDHISSYQEVVQNYLIDHGKMILQVFSNFPDDAIRRCSFARILYDLVNEKHHTDDIMEREEILNAVANMKPEVIEEPTLSKWSEISVTTTKLVNSIWSRGVPNFFPTLSMEDDVEEKNIKVELTENAGDNFKEIEEKKILKNKSTGSKWVGSVGGLTSAGEALYDQAVVHSYAVVVGSVVIVEKDDAKQETEIYIVEYMFGTSDARKMVHGRLLVRGFETILGSFANKKEVFLTNICKDFELINVVGTVVIEFQKLTCDKQACHSKRGPPCDYFSKGLYCPEKGSIYSLQSDSVGLGNGHCFSCEYRESLNLKVFKVSTSMRHFTYEGVDYHVYDFLYLNPGQLAEDKGCRKSLRNDRAESFPPYLVCQFLELKLTMPMDEASPEYLLIKVRRYFRPEDISTERAYISDIREVYYSRQEFMVPITAVRGKCEVRRKKCFEFSDNPYVFEHIFFCEHQYDTENGALKQLPPRVKLSSVPKQSSSEKAQRRKTKSNCNSVGKKSDNQHSEKLATPKKFLSALDLFAGCGGLSEGLHQSGVSVTKWAIEADEPAGRAFQLNHPEASVIINNCNVILRAVMLAFGKASDCISTSDIIMLEQELDKKVMDRLPQRGQVDFIYGGPPCQGFSKLNRFTDRPWSVSQSVLILNFLSFVDVYRPKFVLIENVRNFITFNKGEMFSFALASLIEMGYQVRFGVLEAGAFGISQSRKRAFIWAAAPGETLPEWPEPMHVFAGHDLNVTVDNNTKYAAVRSTSNGAPFRAITVRDSIGDLPQVKNGSSEDTMRYKRQPSSWFQKRVRGDQGVLTDHIAKELSELNLTRCQKVPKHNGSDWRTLPIKKIKLSNGRSVDLVPQGIRNTAHRHNQWKGVFGRLNWNGYFPTTTTDPHPMHKVGRCFHPEQDRILTIREYARSQGFPDSYNFFGTIQDKHRQIGNAVPPPLAFALGRKLKEAVEGKQQNQ